MSLLEQSENIELCFAKHKNPDDQVEKAFKATNHTEDASFKRQGRKLSRRKSLERHCERLVGYVGEIVTQTIEAEEYIYQKAIFVALPVL